MQPETRLQRAIVSALRRRGWFATRTRLVGRRHWPDIYALPVRRTVVPGAGLARDGADSPAHLQDRLLSRLDRELVAPRLVGRRHWPDIYALRGGQAMHLEAKMPGKKATPGQLAMLRRLGRAGAIVGVVHSVEEALCRANQGCPLTKGQLTSPRSSW